MLHQKTSNNTLLLQSSLVTSLPFYYGWIILFAGMMGFIMSSPGQTYSVSIFIEHLIQDLGITRSTVSTLYMIGTLTAGLTMPFVGRQIDQRGPRAVVIVVTILFSLSCIYMGFVQNALMLGIGFLLIRMLGQGSMTIVSGNIINQWWVLRRGIVFSIVGVLAGLLGSGSFPYIINMLIERFGWRSSYQILGLAIAAVMLPIGIFLYKSKPEDYGLLPDGMKKLPADKPIDDGRVGTNGELGFIEENWTSSEAVHTSAFWIIGLGLASISMLGTGLQFHMVSIFADAGLSTVIAAGAFMSVAIAGAIVRIGSGVFIDRFPARYLLFAALLGQTASLLIAPHLSASTVKYYSIILGVTGSLQMTVNTVIWAKYFGRKHLGRITGIAAVLNVCGSALGPMPMGIARDLLGSYTLGLSILAILPLILAIVTLFSREPHRKNVAADEMTSLGG